MLVGGYIGEEYIDIVLPQEKVNKVLLKIIEKNNKCDSVKAKEILKANDLSELCKKYEKQIRANFKTYIWNELKNWEYYEKMLNKIK